MSWRWNSEMTWTETWSGFRRSWKASKWSPVADNKLVLNFDGQFYVFRGWQVVAILGAELSTLAAIIWLIWWLI